MLDDIPALASAVRAIISVVNFSRIANPRCLTVAHPSRRGVVFANPLNSPIAELPRHVAQMAGSAHLETNHVRSSTFPQSLRRRRHPRTDVSTV
jgi:hypothetical protein